MKKIISAAIAMMLILALLSGTACAQSMYPEFREIFESRSLTPVFMLDILRPGKPSVVLAGVFPDGIVDLHEIAGKNDSDEIQAMANFIYFPFAGMNSEERMIAESNIQAQYAALDAEAFIEISYWMEDDYFVVEINYQDLDVKENVRSLSKFGMMPEGKDSISFEDTKNSFLSQGYVEGGLMW